MPAFRRWRCGTPADCSSTARSLAAFIAPTTNSYKRLVPGYEAPVNLAYSRRNRSAAVRIPMYSNSPKAKRLEFRPPDPSCNIYLAFSAMLMAGLDGIKNKIDPGKPLDKDIFELSARSEARPVDARLARRGAQRSREGSTPICSKAASSPRTSSKPGSTTRGRTRRMPCGCARIRTSSTSITTSRPRLYAVSKRPVEFIRRAFSFTVFR